MANPELYIDLWGWLQFLLCVCLPHPRGKHLRPPFFSFCPHVGHIFPPKYVPKELTKSHFVFYQLSVLLVTNFFSDCILFP